MTPNTKRLREWAEALESGKYKKGRYKLYNNTEKTFCCLGVACDIYDSTRWVEDHYRQKKGITRTSYPPPEVDNYFGVEIDFIPHLLCGPAISANHAPLSVINDSSDNWDLVIMLIYAYCEAIELGMLTDSEEK